MAICGLSGSTIFSTVSHKWHDLKKKFTEWEMCVLIFSTILSETSLILRSNILLTLKKNPQALKQANTCPHIQTGMYWHLPMNQSNTAGIHIIFSVASTQMSTVFFKQFMLVTPTCAGITQSVQPLAMG
jgi:hypothetical protein